MIRAMFTVKVAVLHASEPNGPTIPQIVTRGVAYSALLSDSRLGSSLFECALLRDNHPFIPGQQPAEHPATIAIAETLFPDVVIKKSQSGAEGSPGRKIS